jgi:mannan polymerase II complex ANP1 subunit
MARRMDFSVVGLPHYTIWHLYEPSVDDIRHMEEMEKERRAHEKEEQAKADKVKKIKEEFGDTNGQWEKDKTDMKKLMANDGARRAGRKVDPQGGEVKS